MKLAIFDIDGTITRTSSERSFVRYLLKQKILTYAHLVRTFLLFLTRHPLRALTGFKQNKMYLMNLKEAELRAYGIDCFAHSIRPNIKHRMLEEIRRRKGAGYKILVLSGSIPCLVEPMKQHIQADFMICSEVESTNGVFTGRMTSRHPYGVQKKILAEDFCKNNSFELSQSCAYANEWADRFLLESAGEPVVVDPDEKLRRLALRRRWTIIEQEIQ